MIIPSQVQKVLQGLLDAGFEAYVVGGCVRDLILKRTPHDWDVATDAEPDRIQEIFPKSFYENTFGTVTVHSDGMDVQVTTYRIEQGYSDKRRPDSVSYVGELKEDLARRDFTINALALSPSGEIIDPFDGQSDLAKKLIRAVGDPHERFNEDALRLMRAIRFSAQLGFSIEEKTFSSIKELSLLIESISKERIRDEFVKLIMSDYAGRGIELMRETGLLSIVLPEIMEGYGVGQNKHHIYDVYEHNLRALNYAVEQKFNLETRIASFLHDVGKPKTKRGNGVNSTFYSHDVVGARMSEQILKRLKFPTETIKKIVLLVRYHLFYYNVDEVTPSSVRRLIKNVGAENMDDLINVRFADRIGSGVPKAEPYKLRHFRYIVETVSKDPVSVKMMAIDGNDVMKILNVSPGPKIGILLNALLSEVLDDPKKNTKEYLEEKVKKLDKLSVSELSEMIRKAEEHIKLLESEERKKYRV